MESLKISRTNFLWRFVTTDVYHIPNSAWRRPHDICSFVRAFVAKLIVTIGMAIVIAYVITATTVGAYYGFTYGISKNMSFLLAITSALGMIAAIGIPSMVIGRSLVLWISRRHEMRRVQRREDLRNKIIEFVLTCQDCDYDDSDRRDLDTRWRIYERDYYFYLDRMEEERLSAQKRGDLKRSYAFARTVESVIGGIASLFVSIGRGLARVKRAVWDDSTRQLVRSSYDSVKNKICVPIEEV